MTTPGLDPMALDAVAAQVSAALEGLSGKPLVVQAVLSDWHLSQRIGRGRLSDTGSNTHLAVVVPAWKQRHTLAKGDLVEIRGAVCWDQRWGLQLVADQSIRRIATSTAHTRLLAWQQQLAAAGSPQHQLVVDDQIARVGLVGPAGGDAALSDTRTVLAELGAQVSVVTARVAMSGPNAAVELAQVLAGLLDQVDVVLIVRGGGASSDLGAWNDPATVDRIANYPIPVICGIGHATNLTATDIVAYHHANTPTSAARWLVEAVLEPTPVAATSLLLQAPTASPAGATAPRREQPGHQPPEPGRSPTPDRLVVGCAVLALFVLMVLVAVVLFAF